MKKILFTDLLGTLISKDLNYTREYYSNLEKETSIISSYLNEFLSENNYIAIVTSPGGHGNSWGGLFNNQLATLSYHIEDDLRPHIGYYLQGNAKIYSDDNIDKEIVNKKVYYRSKHPFVGIGVDRKEYAIDDFLQTIQGPYQLYALGDTRKDIPMLLRAQELGGIGSMIDTTLYRWPRTTNQIIENELDVEFSFKIHDMIKNRPDPGEKYSEEDRALLTRIKERRCELYDALNEGKLNLDELDKNYSKYLELRDYQMDQESCTYSWSKRKDKYWENYPLNEFVINQVMNMPCYPTFGDYYKKVLRKK